MSDSIVDSDLQALCSDYSEQIYNCTSINEKNFNKDEYIQDKELVLTECSICLDEIKPPDSTIMLKCCGKRFHKDCIQTWYNKCPNKNHPQCPLCNENLIYEDIFQTSIFSKFYNIFCSCGEDRK